MVTDDAGYDYDPSWKAVPLERHEGLHLNVGDKVEVTKKDMLELMAERKTIILC